MVLDLWMTLHRDHIAKVALKVDRWPLRAIRTSDPYPHHDRSKGPRALHQIVQILRLLLKKGEVTKDRGNPDLYLPGKSMPLHRKRLILPHLDGLDHLLPLPHNRWT